MENLAFLQQYNTFDLILVAILAISVLVGLIRGVVREVLSVASWAIAIYIALRFAPLVSEQYVKQLIDNQNISYIVSFVALVIVGLIGIGLVNLLISQLFRVAGLSFLNRLLGMVFGGLRGVILGAVAIWVIGLVPSWTKEKWFAESTLVPEYRRVTEMAMAYLPEDLTKFIRRQQENPKLKELEALIKDKGLDAAIEQFKSSNADSVDTQEMQSLLKEVMKLQQAVPSNTQSMTPGATTQPARPESAQPDASQNGLQLESVQDSTETNANEADDANGMTESQTEDKPVIKLESTD